MKCICVGAGEKPNHNIVKETGDLLIAVDGGLNYLDGQTVDMVVGDFDSLGYEPKVGEVVKLEVKKDYTDMWVACQKGYESGYREFWLYGATGGRFDHTLANVQLASNLAKKDCKAVLKGNGYDVFVVNSQVTFDDMVGRGVSVFAADRAVIDLDGFEYAARDLTVTNDFPIGVSNRIIEERAVVKIRQGVAVIVVNFA
ncbi:MAG: thiamine diphosphokinase [Christensenellales bacterium]